MKRARHKQGSVVLNKRSKTWHYLWCDDGGGRRSKLLGTLRDFPTKAAAWHAAESLRASQEATPYRNGNLLVSDLIERYRAEKMPDRYSTRRPLESWLHKYIVPKWGNCQLPDIQPRPVTLWLDSLALTAKSKTSLRSLLHALWEYAMFSGDVPIGRNPMSLVKLRGVTRRTLVPRSLTVDEFRALLPKLREPFRTIALVCVCFGLRISEALALKWGDVNWLVGELRIQRSIVRQRVGDVKTVYSGKSMGIDADMLIVLKTWKQSTEFATESDWVFASPVRLGRLPWSYDQVLRSFVQAGTEAGIGKIGTHTMRHTYRSWLDAVGTPIAVQQKLMRHSDIRTTMNVYGDVVTDEMAQAHSKVVELALKGKVIAN